jgi:hypothetical protein
MYTKLQNVFNWKYTGIKLENMKQHLKISAYRYQCNAIFLSLSYIVCILAVAMNIADLLPTGR